MYRNDQVTVGFCLPLGTGKSGKSANSLFRIEGGKENLIEASNLEDLHQSKTSTIYYDRKRDIVYRFN